MKSQRPLDWLNFFLADVKDGLGPFLAIYLLSSRHWDPGEIGVVMVIAGIATVAAPGPFGALIDWTRWKRALIVIAAVTVALGAVAMSLFPSFWFVAAAQAVIGKRRCRVSCSGRRYLLRNCRPRAVHEKGRQKRGIQSCR